MRRRLLFAAAALAVVAGLAADPAQPSGRLQLGLYDDASFLGRADESFPLLSTLRVRVIRVTLYWGGEVGVATKRPATAADPDDPAYDWAVYDRVVRLADERNIKIVFSIWGTPRWANRGRGLRYAPTRASDLRNFAYAAARRYGGTWEDEEGKQLPAVRYWLAWNEPNNPVFLSPQWKRVRKKWRVQSAVDYAHICSAIYTGVHLTSLAGEKVACGVTGPRGNNKPSGRRSSVGPIPFLRALKKAGLRRFDAYAHHPYYQNPSETPSTKPKSRRGKRGLIAPPVTLGNINELIAEVTRLYGRKRIWVTEYGYQTRPPDRLFGVSWSRQAAYVRQSYRIMRRNPRIDMMLWFLLRDEAKLGGWQSGLLTAAGKRKPAFNTFRSLRG